MQLLWKHQENSLLTHLLSLSIDLTRKRLIKKTAVCYPDSNRDKPLESGTKNKLVPDIDKTIRMNFLRLFIILSLIVNIGCSAQNSVSEKQWFKGNLHAHSYWSDGDEFPEVFMDWYKSKEYQFVALTDHNTLAAGDRWQVIIRAQLY